MSDESAASPENTPTPSAAAAPRAQRISNPRPRKKAKAASAKDEAPAADAPQSSKFPEFPESHEVAAKPDVSAPDGEWPEPEAASSGTTAAPENPKRKRRRKKGKGNGAQNAAPQVEGETVQQPDVEEPAESSPPKAQAQPPRPQNQAPRPKLDSEALAKCAWKIYLAEISEEGVALVGDNDAKELSRRCFRLAEIFMEEQARRR